MQHKFVYFGLDQEKMLSFVDENWDRVIESGYNPGVSGAGANFMSSSNPVNTGYYVKLAKLSVEVEKKRK